MKRVFQKAMALLLSAGMLLGCCGCGKKKEVSPADRLFTYVLGVEPASLDPQAAGGEAAWTVIQNLFEGLCRLDGSGKAISGAAAEWHANDDNTEYRFVLRSGVCWSDGAPLTAADFVYGIRRALDPNTKCPGAAALYCIAGAQAYHNGTGSAADVGVEAVSGSEVRFRLAEPCADFPARTAQSAFMPCRESFFLSTGGQYGMESDQLICNGPFMLRSVSGWAHGEYLRLVRNKHYAGGAQVLPVGLKFEIRAQDDPAAELGDGTVNVAKLTDAQEQAAAAAGLETVSFAETTWGLALRCTGALANEKVRLALVLAIDRTALAPHYPAGAAATVNLVPDAVSCAGGSYRSRAGACAQPASAQTPAELLAAGLNELQTDAVGALQVLCVDTPQNRLLVNRLLTDWRNALGCYLNIETVADEAALEARLQAGTYTIALAPVRAEKDDPAAFLDAAQTLTAYVSAEYDEWTAQRGHNPVTAAQAQETLLVGSGAFCPLYAQRTAYGFGKTVSGVIVHPFGGGVDFRGAGRTE